jgi:hypothetical protein
MGAEMSVESDRNGYAVQKLGQALDCLVNEGPLRLRLTHAAYHLLGLRTAWSVPKESSAIAERVGSIADELTKEPLCLGDHLLPRSHISPKRAKFLAKEILALYTEACGGPAAAAERDPL